MKAPKKSTNAAKTSAKATKSPTKSPREPAAKSRQVKRVSKFKLVRNNLSPERDREILNTLIKMKKTPDLTFDFIINKWRAFQRTRARMSLIPQFRVSLLEQQQRKRENCTDATKLAKIEQNCKRQLERLDKIEEAFRSRPYQLRADHELVLSKIRGSKPMSSYMRYAQSVRASIRAANPDADFGAVGQLIGAKWRDLPEEEKAKFAANSAKAPVPDVFSDVLAPEPPPPIDSTPSQKKNTIELKLSLFAFIFPNRFN